MPGRQVKKCVSRRQCRLFGAWIGQGKTEFKDKVRGVKISKLPKTVRRGKAVGRPRKKGKR